METQPLDLTKIKIGIDPPPDYIYEFRRHRQAPAQEVWGVENGTVSYIPQRAEYVEGKGNFVYYYGMDIPSKTVAPVEAIHAVGIPKRILINTAHFIASLPKKGRINRLIALFNDLSVMFLGPYYLVDGYYCGIAKQVRKAIQIFLVSMGVELENADRFAKTLASMVEYDNAYRWRFQDLCGETSLEKLLEHLPKELERLMVILKSRETSISGGEEVLQRLKSITKILKWIWWMPSWRKKLRNAIRVINLDECRMDQQDIVHSLLFKDYNVRGKTLEERLVAYEEIFGKEQSKWPPRILIKPN